MTLSARNKLEGKITEPQLGGVMAHVVVRVGDNLIESVITRRSAEEMDMKEFLQVAVSKAPNTVLVRASCLLALPLATRRSGSWS
jgi:molybdopterin-binding protein